jgi:hypothetical protein
LEEIETPTIVFWRKPPIYILTLKVQIYKNMLPCSVFEKFLWEEGA